MAQGSGWMLVAAGLMAVVVAPIVEEFFFRVLLQGWLEAGDRRRRRQLPQFRRLLPIGGGPIVLASLAFAALHIRGPEHARSASSSSCLSARHWSMC